MPNWCNNSVTFLHDDSSKVKAVAEALESGDGLFSSFQPVAENEDQSEAWGTKWDVTEAEIVDISEDGITLVFETAWGPPLGFYEHMESLGYDVEATYCEWGMQFVGSYENGISESFDFDDMPEELDEIWGISEMLAEWEEENESEDD